jgi:glycosyltransferase involved in cell wall biosynthesis
MGTSDSMLDLYDKKSPIRILHVIHRMRPGGAQTLVMNLYRHIDKSRVQFDFAVRSQQPEYYDQEIETLGGRLFHLPWHSSNPFNIVGYIHALDEILQKEGPFAGIHSHVELFNGHILPVSRKAGVKLRIAHSHSASTDKTSILRNIWGKIMRRSIQNNATHFLACSSTAAEWLYGDIHQDARFSLFPNAIDLTPYANIHSDRYFWRQKTGLPLKGPLLGPIGRFDSVKNHSFLLQVFSKFLDLFPTAKLILVGEGILKTQVENEAKAKGFVDSICFLGVRSDIPQILGALDLFVLPSLHEGLGIVLIEAQAAGVPCLVSDTIPTEVDLGLGLIQFKNLDIGVNGWVQELQDSKLHKKPDWNNRKIALQKAGYNIQRSAKSLQELYLSMRL